MITELRDLSYEERLKEFGLATLETRWLISLKKVIRTRRHQVILVKDQCRLDIRKYSFLQRKQG